MTIDRRTVLKSAAWAAPAVVVATATPAFAVSNPAPSCTLNGCKFPGKSNKKNIKSYRLEVGTCSGGRKVKCVFINGKTATWDGRYWWLKDQPNSKSPLPVTIYFTDGSQQNTTVKFLPCKC